MNYEFIEYSNTQGIVRININRPDKRNALAQGLMQELVTAFEAINEDETARVVILSGNGKTFVAGADIEKMSQLDAPGYMDYGSLFNKMIKTIRENNKPVIAAVNGVAFGGGNVLALACDIIVAADVAKFSQPEIHLGIFGGGALLPQLIGRYRAAEIVLLGDAYSAQEAKEMGLVNKVVPLAELENTVLSMAQKICAKSPLAVKLGKKTVLTGTYNNLNTATDHNLALMSVMFGSQDQKEGMKSFLEKRTPVFTGR